MSCVVSRVFGKSEDYEQLVEDIVRDGRLYASENHQEILKVSGFTPSHWVCYSCTRIGIVWAKQSCCEKTCLYLRESDDQITKRFFKFPHIVGV